MLLFKRNWDCIWVTIVKRKHRVVASLFVAEMHTYGLVFALCDGKAIFVSPGFDFLYAFLHLSLDSTHRLGPEH